jgi:hypothetical protein
MPLKTCHNMILPYEINNINVPSASARNGAVEAEERDSDAEIHVHDTVTADILTLRGVESEGKGPHKEVMQRFHPLWKIKFSQG